jgi:hypothetical protein
MDALVLLLLLSCQQRHFSAFVVGPNGYWNWWSDMTTDQAIAFEDAGLMVFPEWTREYKDTAETRAAVMRRWLDSLGVDLDSVIIQDNGIPLPIMRDGRLILPLRKADGKKP